MSQILEDINILISRVDPACRYFCNSNGSCMSGCHEINIHQDHMCPFSGENDLDLTFSECYCYEPVKSDPFKDNPYSVNNCGCC